jgi:hypothetical protein
MAAEELLTDDQSHYEVSLTAGQAFLAFVLLLLSLAASFAFGLMIGRGQADERLVVRDKPGVVNEAAVAPKKDARIVELGVADDDFKAPEAPVEKAAVSAPKITEEPMPAAAQPAPDAPAVPHYAQLLSSSDQKAAENLAAKLIDGGFTSAYVERGVTEKGPVFRVRVRFSSEAEARAAEERLKTFSKDVWITKQ